MKDEDEWEKDCCMTCIEINPGAKKEIKGTPRTSPLSAPIAKDKTSKNSKDEISGEKIVSIIVFKLIIDIEITNYFLLVVFTLLSSFILGNIGIIAGLWAEKFDHMATVTNFVIVPLSFLSGTFYSIERLPEALQIISKANPFFYMIDGFRYSFIGKADGSIFIGLIYLSVLSFISWFVTYLLYKKGYKIKS